MFPFIRVLGGKRQKFRIFRGTERQDTVKLALPDKPERTLRGYVRERKIGGSTVVETCFFSKREKTLLTVEGYDPYWLAARNSITNLKRPEIKLEAA